MILNYLKKLFKIKKAEDKERHIVYASFEIMRCRIRNRDAHGYVENVRAAHHFLIPELFVKSIEILVGWIPDGSDLISKALAQHKCVSP
jgi:hypothetical protein